MLLWYANVKLLNFLMPYAHVMHASTINASDQAAVKSDQCTVAYMCQ